MYLPLMSSLGLSYRLSDKEFWHRSIEIQGFYPLPRNEEFWVICRASLLCEFRDQLRITVYVTADSHIYFRAILNL